MIDRTVLNKALNENVPDISGKNIWIWGAGNTAQLYQEGFKRLSRDNFEIQGYIDNDLTKIGDVFNGKPIISPAQLKQLENICILLCSIRPEVLEEVGVQLNELRVEWYLVDEVILKTHRKEVMLCYDLLYDKQSKDTFANLIIWRISGKKTNVKVEWGNNYFALEPFTLSSPDEIFVDCGAWRGDVVEQYIEKKKGIFRKVIAFEPDIINFEALKESVIKIQKKWNLDENVFKLHMCGVGEKTVKACFERYEANNGLSSKFYNSGFKNEGNCSIVSLDEYLVESYSFLKADIESFEYQMLVGAENGIKNNKPLLAICIYHNSVDLFSIPLLVKSMVPEYKIAVRHHSDTLSETVLYAWI